MSKFGGLQKHETLHTGEKTGNNWVAPYYGCSLTPGESSPTFLCIALGQENYLI